MSLSIAFWIVMLLWFLGGGASVYADNASWKIWAPSLIPFILFALLGWQVFGAAIK